MVELSVNNELGRVWKEAVMAKFVIPLRKDTRNLSPVSQSVGQVLNPDLLDIKHK
jgi:hypothetical protein